MPIRNGAPIAEAAEISPEDVEKAKDWWRRNAEPKFKRLLSAQLLRGRRRA